MIKGAQNLNTFLKNYSPQRISVHARLTLMFAIVLVSLLPDISYSEEPLDPGLPDTLRIDSVEGFKGGKAVVPVYLINDETIAGVTLKYKFDPVALTLDSFSFADALGAIFPDTFINIDDTLGILEVAGFSVQQVANIEPGSGILGRMFFSIPENAIAGTYTIDTTSIDLGGPNPIRTSLSAAQTDTTPAFTIFPTTIAGAISIPEVIPPGDSIWFDPVITGPGQSFVLDIFCYNEKELDTLIIPLTYDSDSLHFDFVSFDGTRGILAGDKRLVQNNDELRQFRIFLAYFDTSPLSPGSGLIARAHFTVNPGTQNMNISVDTAAFLGIEKLRFVTSVSEGAFSFTPGFSPGSIVIDFRTDVNDVGSAALPTRFALAQNYPNPFNPSTKISFSLPEASSVTLEVLNILGQRVATIIDERFAAGEYLVEFNALNANGERLATGVYFYRLTAGSFTQTRKMTFLK
ncbi:MAG: T9SS type A sorting domain-containing protein [candidate division Zixibacteria bacterium]|nr:T9SS type A sorting domain-containing protein [candidate division Zixibacteria bacterium]